MRTILAVAISAFFILVGFWLSADAGPNAAKSIEPTVTTSKAPDFPQPLFLGL
jgi:hypothetical protein